MAFQNEAKFREIVSRFGSELIPEAARAVATQLFLFGLKGVVARTPVDKGFLRGRWQAQVGSIPRGAAGPADKSGSATIARGTAVATAARPFSIYYLANNSPQILVAEHGGWVPKNPKTDEESLRRRAARRSPTDRRRAQQAAGDEGAPLIRGGYSLQAPRGMLGVTIEEMRQKADAIARSIAPKVRLR